MSVTPLLTAQHSDLLDDWLASATSPPKKSESPNVTPAPVMPRCLVDLLSVVMMRERTATRLYRSVSHQTQDPQLRARFDEGSARSAQHLRTLQVLMNLVGGGPGHASHAAEIAELHGIGLIESTYLLAGSVDEVTAEIVLLDAVQISESRHHQLWSELSDVADALLTGILRDTFSRIIDRVRHDTDGRLDVIRSRRDYKSAVMDLDVDH